MQVEKSEEDTERLSFHENGTATIIRYSLMTGTFNKATITITEAQYTSWKNGALIQDAMPNLSKEEREFILTGYTPDDWEKMFPPEDEE
jgi:hypothetical protein